MAILLARQTPAAESRAAWEVLSEPQRLELLDLLEERLVIPRPIEVHVGERTITNKEGVALIDGCRGKPLGAWGYDEVLFLTTLWLWELSKIALTELNQADLGYHLLDDFFRGKWRRYARLAGREADRPPDALFDVARSLPALRDEVERDYVRCMTINGATWERREWFQRRSDLPTDAIPPEFIRFVEGRLPVQFPRSGPFRERFATWTDGIVDQGVNPAEGLVALAEYVLLLPSLRADYSIVTCARGIKFDQPWRILLGDVMSYTAIKEGYDPKERGVRLNYGQIRNAISQRMRYNVVCRMKNYSPVREERMQAQSFQYPDVAEMEDAHHNGHRANGVRFVLRSPFVLEVPVDGERKAFRGMGDLRVNRASHRDADRFTRADLPLVLVMSLWMKAVVERAFARGLLLDEKYCAKQDYYKDKDGARVDVGGVLRR
jgi:hypothetical protein